MIFLCVLLEYTGGLCGSYLGICVLTGDSSQNHDIRELPKKLQKRLQFEHLAGGVLPVIIDGTRCDSCIALVYGEVIKIDSSRYLHLRISDNSGLNIDEKDFPLSSYSIEDIIDLGVLKINTFLERKYFVKVRVSSMPLDCDLYLNGVKVGVTPSELTLENGNYRVSLEHEYCAVYRDSLTILPGKDVDLNATLDFKGFQTKPLLFGSVFLSLATAGFWLAEYTYHKEYLGLDKGSREFNNYFKRYQAANYIRIGLLNTGVLSWSFTGFFID
ncbi:MAG TPA: PEGA domain-containing protein [Chitinispirillaceae bacterium]|nr:PEGA domain-containing protein [Chitinispirillaceae bacterium]